MMDYSAENATHSPADGLNSPAHSLTLLRELRFHFVQRIGPGTLLCGAEHFTRKTHAHEGSNVGVQVIGDPLAAAWKAGLWFIRHPVSSGCVPAMTGPTRIPP